MLSIFALTLSPKFCKALLFKSQLHSDSAVSALGEPHILHSSLAGYSSYPQTFWHLVSLTLSPIFFLRKGKERRMIQGEEVKRRHKESALVCLCVCLCDRDKTNKTGKRLTMLSGLLLCLPAACSLNHQDTGDTSKSYPSFKTLLPSSTPNFVFSLTPLRKNSKSSKTAVHKICAAP